MRASRHERAGLALILVLYLALAVLFAAFTPAWQAPDEPAHYNYVRYLAEMGAFPVLHMGDYPHAYLEEIKSRGFPPDLSVDPIRYEFHQPPLYYALVAPIYSLTGGDLLALRLASVVLGAGIVLLAYAIARRLLPARHALATTAFVALLPQHLATVSQVGNDVLAELLYAAVLYLLLDQTQRRKDAKTQSCLRLGILLGLTLITKTTAYIAVPLSAGVLVWRWSRERAGMRRILVEVAAVLAPAALIALPWYARNIGVYGWPDVLGLARHDQVVVGQMRAAEYIAQQGWGAYWQRAVLETFRSFWGQFGWMGVVMDSRVYFALAILSLVALGGLLARRGRTALRRLNPALTLLLASAFLTLLVFAWYNTRFLQHQGRYLFTALIPLAIFFSLGWEGALRPRAGGILAAALVVFGLGLAAWGVLAGHGLPKWPLAMAVLLAGVLAMAAYGTRSGAHRLSGAVGQHGTAAPSLAAQPWAPLLHNLLFALPFMALPLLDLYAIFGAIVPQLTR